MIVPCPRCGKEVPFEGNPFRPFCSRRCKLIDLGNWASGTYRVPGAAEKSPPDPPDPDDSSESAPPDDGGAAEQ